MFTLFFVSIAGVFLLVAAGYLYSFFVEQSQKKTRLKMLSRISNAETLLQSGMYDDGFAIYEEILDSLKSGNKWTAFQDVYALCRYGEGKYFQRKAADDFTAYTNAVECYEEFLRYLSMPGLGLEEIIKKIEAHYNLGLLYVSCINKPQVKNRMTSLKRAEHLLTAALEFINEISLQPLSPEESDQQEHYTTKVHASIYQALGVIYSETSDTGLPKNAEKSLLKAIDAFDKALQFFTAQEYPAEHTEILSAYANVYKKLFALSGNINFMTVAAGTLKTLADYLERNDRQSELFTVIQDLGDSYMLMAQHLAETGTEENNQNNEAKNAALTAAAEYYKKMIDIPKGGNVFVTNSDLALMYQKVGSATIKLYHIGQHEPHLEEGLSLYQKALEYVAEGSLDFANVQSVIGDLYVVLSRTHDRKENIAKAKAALNTALRIYDDMGLTPYKKNIELSLKNIDGW